MINREIKRKLIHSLGITTIVVLAYFGRSATAAIILGIMASFILLGMVRGKLQVLKGFEGWTGQYERRGEFPLKGAIMFYMGSLASVVLFSEQIAMASIAVLSISDSVATLVGSLYGSHKLPVNRKSSWEGSIAFFATALPIILLFAYPLKAVVVAILVTLIEMLPDIDDNITIPISVGLLLTFL